MYLSPFTVTLMLCCIILLRPVGGILKSGKPMNLNCAEDYGSCGPRQQPCYGAMDPTTGPHRFCKVGGVKRMVIMLHRKTHCFGAVGVDSSRLFGKLVGQQEARPIRLGNRNVWGSAASSVLLLFSTAAAGRSDCSSVPYHSTTEASGGEQRDLHSTASNCSNLGTSERAVCPAL